jgi:DNA-binding CsgD family transcriptional regulator
MANDGEQSEQVRQALLYEAMQNNPTARLEDDLYYKELFQSLPMPVILGGLSDYELRLLYMNAVEEMSPKEIALIVNEDPARVRYALNKIYSKIRYRLRKILTQTGGDN